MSWNIEAVVDNLRAVRRRTHRLQGEVNRNAPLPNKESLGQVVAGITAALFPRHAVAIDHSAAGLSFYAGDRLNTALWALVGKIENEHAFDDERREDHTSNQSPRAIVKAFAEQLPRIYEVLESDVLAAFEGDPSARSTEEVLLSFPGIRATIHHRIAHALHTLGAPVVARIIAALAHSSTGIDIHPGASPPATALPGSNASSIPQPPDTKPPQQVLISDTGLQTSQGFDGYQLTDHIPLPFEREMNALLAPLAVTNAAPLASGLSASPTGSDFYFLNQVFPQAGSAPAIGQHSGHPGQALPGLSGSPFTSAHPAFDVNAIRRDFPILSETVNGRPLIWFDNEATTQKPKLVIDRLMYFYEHKNSNIHRAAHELAARSTEAYEGAHQKIARFIGASTPDGY